MNRLRLAALLFIVPATAMTATKSIVGTYTCTGTASITLTDPILPTQPKKTDRITGKLLSDKDGGFHLTITTAGYQNLIAGKMTSNSPSSVSVDVGNYSFSDLMSGKLPGPLWNENKSNLSSNCGCIVGAEFYTAASGSRIANARRLNLKVDQEWRERRSTLDREYSYDFVCKK